jgi:hypothetical protein
MTKFPQYLRQKWREMSDCVRNGFLPTKVKIRTNTKAHHRYFSTFTTFESLSGIDNHKPNESIHIRDVGHDRSCDNARHLPLDRERWQLPDSTTLLFIRFSLGQHCFGYSFSIICFVERKHTYWPETVWQEHQLDWYGEARQEVEIATGTAVCYTPRRKPLPIRCALVRDPLGELLPAAFMATNMSPNH